MSHKKNFLRKKGNLYQNAVGAYTLNNIFGNWTNAVLKIRRTSDSTTAYVFFDGTTITTSSFISTSSNTTPSATTLTTWIGANDGYVEEWFFVNPSNSITAGHTASQTTTTKQPKVITSGAIDTYNSLPTIYFDGGDLLVSSGAITDLDDGNAFTIIWLSANTVSNSVGVVFCTSPSNATRLATFNDRRTNKVNSGVFVGASTYLLTNAAQDNTSNQKIQAMTADTSLNITAYKDGAYESTTTYVGSYFNTAAEIGAQHTELTKITGHIQEILVFSEDETANITALQDLRNSYYSVY